jgi:carnosine N-methyltransferase
MAERRYTEQEEALEISSLRRIIAAYANYHDAAERDVKRYERSFKRLPPAHKELLFNLGLKYQRLRW